MKKMLRRSISVFLASVMCSVGVLVLAPNGPASAMPVGSFLRQVPDPIDADASTEQFGVVGPRITPSVDGIQVVELETWLAIDPDSYVETSWTKDGVNYRAEPGATVWDFTDRTIRCDGPGVEYTPGAAGPAPCGRDWEHTTSVGPMTMTVRVEYEVFWDYEEQLPAPTPPPPPPPPPTEYDEDGNVIEPPATTLPPPPPPPPPIRHSGSYTDFSEPGVWNLQVGEIQTNGVDGDAPTVTPGDDGGSEPQSTERVPGTAEDDSSPFDNIDCGTIWTTDIAASAWAAVCPGVKWALNNIPGIDTVFSLVDGCFENVTDFLDSIVSLGKQALAAFEDPIAFVNAKIEEFKALYEAIVEAPGEFALEFLGDVAEIDLFNENRAAWIGKMGCQAAMAVFTGGGPIASRVMNRIDDIIDWTKRMKRDRNNGPDRDRDNDSNSDNDSDNDSDNGNDNDDNDSVSTCGTNSFPTGTMVLMADGSYVAIDMIRPGDRVLAANTTTGAWSPRPVLDQWSHLDAGHMATVTLIDGSSVTATDHHEFWVASDGAWIELDDVQEGDFLLTPNGVTEVAALQVGHRQDTLVWELDVAVDNTFTVHTGTLDVLVHNAGCVPDSGAFRGISPGDAEDLIPEGWTKSPTRGEGGYRYSNPDVPGEQIRIMPGKLTDPNPLKQGPYVRISTNGVISEPIPLIGNPTL